MAAASMPDHSICPSMPLNSAHFGSRILLQHGLINKFSLNTSMRIARSCWRHTKIFHLSINNIVFLYRFTIDQQRCRKSRIDPACCQQRKTAGFALAGDQSPASPASCIPVINFTLQVINSENASLKAALRILNNLLNTLNS